MSDIIGRTFNGYQVIEQIGRGGMATVYKAYQPSLDRYIALKFLPPYYAHQDDTFLERFKREARVVAKLRHPNILMVMDFGQEDDMTFIVMDYVEAGTLKERIQRPITLTEIANFINQIGSALDYAHAEGVVHRDVKPSNVLLPKPDWVLLTDFGLAHMVGGSMLTQSGLSVGTPAYMAPEQGSGDAVDARSDVYSLGVMLYEMTTGDVPYTAETPMAVMIKHIVEPLPIPRERNPKLLESLELVILKSMAKDPKDRYQSAGELAQAVIEVANQHPDWSTSELPLPIKIKRTVSDPPDSRTIIEDDDRPTIIESQETAKTRSPESELKKPRKSPLGRVLAAVTFVIILGAVGFFAYPTLFGSADLTQSDSQLLTNENMQVALDYLEEGQTQEALIAFDIAISQDPNQSEIYLATASDAYFILGEHEFAINMLEIGLPHIENPPASTLANFGQWYVDFGDIEHALDAFNSALEIDPEQPWVYISIAELSLNMEDTDQFFAALQSAVDNAKSDGYILNSAAWLYFHAGDYPTAADVFQQSIDADPALPWSYIGLAQVFVALQEGLEEVPPLLLSASQNFNQDANVLDSVGWLYYELHDCEQAMLFFEQALSIDRNLENSMNGVAACQEAAS